MPVIWKGDHPARWADLRAAEFDFACETFMGLGIRRIRAASALGGAFLSIMQQSKASSNEIEIPLTSRC